MKSNPIELQALHGTWVLKEFLIETSQGTVPWRAGAHGILIYAPDGYMSLSVNSDQIEDPAEDSYFFYAGTFELAGCEVRHHIKNATGLGRIGVTVCRQIFYEDKILTLSGSDQFGSGSISWLRA